MTYRMGLIHRAVIQRSEGLRTPTSAQGVTGQPVADWTDPGNVNEREIECRLVERSERVASAAGLQVFKSYTAFLPADADVLNEDRVKQVEMEDGVIVGPFVIETVTPKRNRRGLKLIVLSLKKVE